MVGAELTVTVIACRADAGRRTIPQPILVGSVRDRVAIQRWPARDDGGGNPPRPPVPATQQRDVDEEGAGPADLEPLERLAAAPHRLARSRPAEDRDGGGAGGEAGHRDGGGLGRDGRGGQERPALGRARGGGRGAWLLDRHR